jgi:hypothetical protein
MKNLIKLIFISFFFATCSTVSVGDTSQNALDWPGTYKCEKMTITLRENNTFKAQVGSVEVRSSFRWDKQGQSICLNHFKAKGSCKKFLVGENVLIPLKNSGRPIKESKPLIKISAP